MIIVTIWKQFPLATVILLVGLQAVPRELYEAAEIDGASKLQKSLYATMPDFKPVNNVLVVMLILYAFKRISLICLFAEVVPVGLRKYSL